MSLDHYGSVGRPVRLRQFVAMHAVIGRKVERAVDVDSARPGRAVGRQY